MQYLQLHVLFCREALAMMDLLAVLVLLELRYIYFLYVTFDYIFLYKYFIRIYSYFLLYLSKNTSFNNQ